MISLLASYVIIKLNSKLARQHIILFKLKKQNKTSH